MQIVLLWDWDMFLVGLGRILVNGASSSWHSFPLRRSCRSSYRSDAQEIAREVWCTLHLGVSDNRPLLWSVETEYYYERYDEPYADHYDEAVHVSSVRPATERRA